MPTYLNLRQHSGLMNGVTFYWKKSKPLLSFDANIERTPLINKCLQVKIYFYGNRERIDERDLERLNYLVYGCWLKKTPKKCEKNMIA